MGRVGRGLVGAGALALVVSVVAARPPAASSDGTTPSADLVGTLSGPTMANIGDVITYTVTATNRGPDAGVVGVAFAMSKGAAFDLVGANPDCPQSSTVDQVMVKCDPQPIAAGATMQLSVQVHVTQIAQTTVDGFANPYNVSDPDTTNNAVSTVVFTSPPAQPPTPSSSPSPPPPTVAPPPSPPPYTFVDQLPPATEWQPYEQPTITCATACSPQQVVLVGGDLPPGLTLSPDGTIAGTPETTGSSTITLEAQPFPTDNMTVIRHDYTVTVLPDDATPAQPAPPPWWQSCAALHRRYPHGVGRLHAVDRTRGERVTSFKRSNALYGTAIRHNRALDPDRDGIACEKR